MNESKKQTVTLDGLVKILIITAICVFSFIAYHPYSPAGKQAKNLTLARAHANLLKPSIESDPRFTQISVGGFTGEGGMLYVGGWVSNDQDFESLKTFVEASNPPVETKWNVEVEIVIEEIE